VCVRLIPQRSISSRQTDLNAEQLFNSKATSKSVTDLLINPQRDVYSYDQKDPIHLSTQAISTLHARIGLPSSFPLTTLERCLTDPSTQKDHSLHNEALSVIGSGLLEYYVSEYLCVRWPRLPMKTQLAALWAYTGESALARLAREWGVQSQTISRDTKNPNSEEIDDGSPKLLVNTSKGSARHDLEVNMNWEIREQARQGWSEPHGRSANKGYSSILDKKEHEKRFVLFALQRFVQSLVGGVYFHSVYPSSRK
jgi:dsRNA-specific ribonuclease